MLALTTDAVGSLRLAELPEPQVCADEALVGIEQVGICGTDLKILNGAIPVRYPLVLGHELVGRVLATGGGTTLAVGQAVLVNPATWCGRCPLCRSGRANLCRSAGRMGIDIPGGAVDKLAVPVERLISLPDDLLASTAVLLQVLGTCVHAQRLINLFPGQRAAVIGLGVSGLLHIQLLRARGLDVVAVGRSPAKLELARRVGAGEALSVDQAREWASQPARQFDIVVEAAGAEASLALATDLAKPGATLLVFGIHGRSTPAPFQDFYVKELAVINARGATALDYEQTVQLVSDSRIVLDAIEIRRYPLAEAEATFKAAAATSEVVKFVLQP